MSSITNQIVANIKSTSSNFNSFNFVNSENVVCIDTSNNRIGINRKNPVYSIDISGDSSHNAIRVNNLHITNLAKIEEISCSRLDTDEFFVNLMDASNLTFKLISGDIIDVSFLIVRDISIAKLAILDLSCNFMDISNNINSENINVRNELSANIIKVNKLVYPIVELNELTVNDASINTLQNIDLSSNNILAYEISVNRLYVKDKLISLNDACFNNICIEGDASINKLLVDNLADLNTISANIIKAHELSSNTINAQTITSNGSTIINNGVFGDVTSPTNAVFNDLSANTLDISNVNISKYLNNSGLTDLSNGMLNLPLHKTAYNSNEFEPGTITFDNSLNILKIYNTKPTIQWNNISFNVNFASMSLKRDISGNDISFNVDKKNYFIDQSDNLILDTVNYPNYKYIPINFDNSFGNKFDLSNNNKTIEIKNQKDTELFEIHATVVIQYLNKFPGDVEPNDYVFGIYPHMNSITESIDNSFVSLKNTVISFDNSFNFSNISINYIGKLYISDNSYALNFYISSKKDINYIVINQFNGTIKQISS